MCFRSVVMALLVTATSLAWGQSSDYTILREDIAPDNSLRIYEVTCEEAEASPPWNPQESLPPLSVIAAIRIARQWASDSLGIHQDLAVASIKLSPIQSESFSNRWFYTISLVPQSRMATGASYWTTIAILMDGKVVVPRKA